MVLLETNSIEIYKDIDAWKDRKVKKVKDDNPKE